MLRYRPNGAKSFAISSVVSTVQRWHSGGHGKDDHAVTKADGHAKDGHAVTKEGHHGDHAVAKGHSADAKGDHAVAKDGHGDGHGHGDHGHGDHGHGDHGHHGPPSPLDGPHGSHIRQFIGEHPGPSWEVKPAVTPEKQAEIDARIGNQREYLKEKQAKAKAEADAKDAKEHPYRDKKPKDAAYFETGKWMNKKSAEDHDFSKEPKGDSDNLKYPEFDTIFGKFETRPTGTGDVNTMRYYGYRRDPPGMPTYDPEELRPTSPIVGHHPNFDYLNRTGDGQNEDRTKMASAFYNVDIKLSVHTLYRNCLKSLSIVKVWFKLLITHEKMKERIKSKFLQNKHVRDPDAIRHLLAMGWIEYYDAATHRKTKGGMMRYFSDSEDHFTLMKHYMGEEKKLLEDKAFWNGEDQKKEGPYDGFWSFAGRLNAQEFDKLKGRTPMSWTASKGYFELWKCDGTNAYEKNLDYEGWYVKNVDPDRFAARKEIQNWVEAGYNQPKHYAAKNRRAYRRMVQDVRRVMTESSLELYASSREQMFQYFTREECPETNRIHAEKRLARQDDEVFTTKFEEYDNILKQVMREMPNPRLWKTDAFYLRMRFLLTPLEFNWAKAPIGMALEKGYNEWISNDVNYAISLSKEFDNIRRDKKRNPMAKSWTDFVTEFDPDVPETRQLPWYHKDFNYDRRHHWDERIMRMKKWVASGDINFKHSFFDKEIFDWEQHINRPETVRQAGSIMKRYAAPRCVQLYRSLNKRMDIALANQMKEYCATVGRPLPESNVEKIASVLATVDFAKFKFEPPVVIYPDGVQQPELGIDGRPLPTPIPESQQQQQQTVGQRA